MGSSTGLRRLTIAAGICAGLMLTAGCTTGRVGALYVFDDAVVVEDASDQWPTTALVTPDRVFHFRGTVVPIRAVRAWIVVDEPVSLLGMVRTSRLRSQQRLPATMQSHRLHLVEVATGHSRRLPDPPDTNDERVHALRLDGVRLLAAVGERFTVQSEPGRLRYVCLNLPDGQWEALSAEEAARAAGRFGPAAKFADLRSSATGAPGNGPAVPERGGSRWGAVRSFVELRNRGLSRGDWGEIVEREELGRWLVVYRGPDARERVVLR